MRDGLEYLAGESVVAAGTHPGSGTVTARATADHVLAAGALAERSHTLKAIPYSAISSAALFADKEGAAEDSYTVPVTDGVEYLVGEEVVAAGVHAEAGTVTVNARTKADYIPASGAEAEWSHSFSAKFPAVPGSLVPVTPGADGKVTLFNRSSGVTQLLVEVSGYFLPGRPAVTGQPTPPRYKQVFQGFEGSFLCRPKKLRLLVRIGPGGQLVISGCPCPAAPAGWRLSLRIPAHA